MTNEEELDEDMGNAGSGNVDGQGNGEEPSVRPTGMTAFVIVWFGQLVSILGTEMTNFALTIWAYQETGQATALALVGVLPGCAPSTFGCTDDAQCLAGAEQGWCEAGGYCSFEDDACEGGRRYGEFAPSALAGSCVNPDESATSSSTSSSVPNTTTGTADPTLESMTDPASSTDPDADASSSEGGLESSTTGVVPTCDGWWDCAWNQRALVEVTPLAEGDLTSFPVPVRLADAFAHERPGL